MHQCSQAPLGLLMLRHLNRDCQETDMLLMDQLSLCLLPPPFCAAYPTSLLSASWAGLTCTMTNWDSGSHITGFVNTPSISHKIISFVGVEVISWNIAERFLKQVCPLSCIISAFNELNYRWSRPPSSKSELSKSCWIRCTRQGWRRFRIWFSYCQFNWK